MRRVNRRAHRGWRLWSLPDRLEDIMIGASRLWLKELKSGNATLEVVRVSVSSGLPRSLANSSVCG